MRLADGLKGGQPATQINVVIGHLNRLIAKVFDGDINFSLAALDLLAYTGADRLFQKGVAARSAYRTFKKAMVDRLDLGLDALVAAFLHGASVACHAL